MHKVDIAAAVAGERWEEGKIIHLAQGSPRHRVVLMCTESGRQMAGFINDGAGRYNTHVEITGPDGSWVSQGVNVVPVLPDGRLIMVVEQRPAHGRFQGQIAKTFVCDGKEIPFEAYGPHSSLEFPGGAVDPGESFKAGFLRELSEETRVAKQMAVMWERVPPYFQTGADVAIAMKVYVVYLKHMHFEKEVTSDGGLSVLAFRPQEVQENIWRGAIVANQAGLLGWNTYQEVERANGDAYLARRLFQEKYLRMSEVRVG